MECIYIGGFCSTGILYYGPERVDLPIQANFRRLNMPEQQVEYFQAQRPGTPTNDDGSDQ